MICSYECRWKFLVFSVDYDFSELIKRLRRTRSYIAPTTRTIPRFTGDVQVFPTHRSADSRALKTTGLEHFFAPPPVNRETRTVIVLLPIAPSLFLCNGYIS